MTHFGYTRFMGIFTVLKQHALRVAVHYGLRDKWLLLAILLGLGLGLQGFTWGRYDCLNLDRMAFRTVVSSHRPLLQPDDYLKPPLYTYLNHFFAKLPADAVRGVFCFWMEEHKQEGVMWQTRLAISRSLNLLLFALCTTGIFVLVRHYFSTDAARVAALLFSTTAGFVPYQIFLTTDLAVVFMMIAAFLFAVRIINNPGMANSVAAGLLAGLAGATKYNGVAVAVALPVAHLLAPGSGNAIVRALKRKAAWVCGLCVPLGFVLGNPYAVFDWSRFKDDFVYNYVTTPVYGGETAGNSYEYFLKCFLEIFGWPTSLLVIVAIPVGLVAVYRARKAGDSWKPWLMAAVIFGVYYLKFGAFPRLEVRFVLPMAPFVLILASAGFPALLRLRPAFHVLIAAIVMFNLASGWWVGRLFANDPRNFIPDFARKHLQNGGVIEWSKSLPKLLGVPKKNLTVHTIYSGLQRSQAFDKMFANSPNMAALASKKAGEISPEWFSKSSRLARNTDYVMWCSIDVDGVTLPEYNALFDESSGYRIVYDAKSPVLPAWVYPQRTEFLHHRTTIWERIRENGAGQK